MRKSNKITAALGVVAGLGVALAPLSTYATATIEAHYSDAHTDELVVTVEPSCTFGATAARTGSSLVTGIAHTAVTGTTWNDDTNLTTTGDYKTDDVASTGEGVEWDATLNSNAGGYTGNASEHTAFRSMEAGTTKSDFAKTTLTVYCNSSTGYTLKAAAGDLNIAGHNGTTITENIPAAETYSVSASGYNGVASITTEGTTAASTASIVDANIDQNAETEIAKNTDVSLENGDNFEIVYGIGIAKNQKAGVYNGKVVYTLYQGLTQ